MYVVYVWWDSKEILWVILFRMDGTAILILERNRLLETVLNQMELLLAWRRINNLWDLLVTHYSYYYSYITFIVISVLATRYTQT